MAFASWPAAVAQWSTDFSPVSKEELELKDNPANPGAAAMILYRAVRDDDVERSRTEYYRIKVFTDGGKKYGDVEIPWIPKATQVGEIRARTVLPDGTPLEFHGEVFDKTVLKKKKLKVQVKAFSLPQVQKGSIVEYSYTTRWREKPLDVLRNPANYIVEDAFVVPAATWDVQDELFVRRERFSIRPLPKAYLAWTSINLTQGLEPRRQADGTIQLDAVNVSAFQKEEFMPPEGMLKGRVVLYYQIGTIYSTDGYWKRLAELRAEAYEKFLGKPKAAEHELNNLVSPGDAIETKLRKIYDRVQQVRYLSYEHLKTVEEEKRESLKANKNVADILKRDYASANQINLLFVALAHAAGLQAAPVLLAERRTQYFQRNLPVPNQLDAMVVWVRAGNSDYYLDPATRYCPFSLLPWEETDAMGIRADARQPGLVTTPEPKSTDAVIERKGTLTLDAKGDLEGEVTINYSGQEALERRIDNRNEDEAGRRKNLEDEVRGWLPAGATVELKNVSHWDQSEQSLYVAFSIKVPASATTTGHRMLVPPDIFQINGRQPFRSINRVYPVYFDYPYEEADDIRVQLPRGYLVEGLPKPRSINSPFGEYETSIQPHGDSVRLIRHLAVQKFYIPVSYYAALRAFFSQVRIGDEDQMVLEAKGNVQAN